MNKKIVVSDLDFDNIKVNLKEFLSGQSEFSDYDFEGSGLAVLIDVLAYNTHYNALYHNLSVNEAFLDSAVKRDSIVSRASDLGYSVRSAQCGVAVVDLTFSLVGSPLDPPSAITLNPLTLFTATIDDNQYKFFNRQAVTLIRNGTVYEAFNVTLTSGTPLSYSWLVEPGVRFVIPNRFVDKKTLSVKVFESPAANSRSETYVEAPTIVDVTAESRVYWVREIDDGLYEMNFGDGIIGKELDTGNVVRISYFASDLEATNGAREFTYSGPTTFTYNGVQTLSVSTVVDTVTPSLGGTSTEDDSSVKFNAPRIRAAQNRGVVAEDYKVLVSTYFGQTRSISVWGGEDNNPPVYGKVFMCIYPDGADNLTRTQKDFIKNNVLAGRAFLPVEILDPEFIDIDLDVTVYYNERETTNSVESIESIVRDAIISYNENELQKFDGVFRYSKLSRLIDSLDTGIVNNSMTFTLRRVIEPRFETAAQYLINLINPIEKLVGGGSVVSTGFFVSSSDFIMYIEDDGNGVLRMIYYPDSITKTVFRTIGTVDYDLGVIQIDDLNIQAVVDEFVMIIKPNYMDVVSALSQIARIDANRLGIVVVSDKTANGDLRGGYNYTFPPRQ